MRCAGESPRADDLARLEVLCELHNRARRIGCDVRVVRADRDLVELIEFAGLADQLLAPPHSTEQP